MYGGFDVFKTYLAIKLHFTSDSYDYFKYEGKINCKLDTFTKRNDRYFFHKLSTKYKQDEIIDFFVSNFLSDDKKWIGNLLQNDGKDVYLDFEYTLKPNAAEYTGGEKLITKHTFTKDFNEDFINHAVLYDMQFLGFNDLSKEYELKFIITKPDTDFSYVIYYFINLKGETVYEIDDL